MTLTASQANAQLASLTTEIGGNRGQIPIIMMQNHLLHPNGPSSPSDAPRLPAPRYPAR